MSHNKSQSRSRSPTKNNDSASLILRHESKRTFPLIVWSKPTRSARNTPAVSQNAWTSSLQTNATGRVMFKQLATRQQSITDKMFTVTECMYHVHSLLGGTIPADWLFISTQLVNAEYWVLSTEYLTEYLTLSNAVSRPKCVRRQRQNFIVYYAYARGNRPCQI